MFYDILKHLCALNNTNVTTLCNQIGINSGNTGAWKKGKLPGAEILQKIADYFNVSVDYLLEREDIKSPAPISDRDRAILERIAKMSPENQAKADEYLDLLLMLQASQEEK